MKLTFGTGTRVIVKPKRDEPLDPSVYLLRPTSPTPKAAQGLAACLATDYFPNEYNLTVKAGNISKTSISKNAMVSIADKSYSLLSFLNANGSLSQDDITCELDPKRPGNDENDVGELSCIPVEETDEDGEHIRGISLTVFGMRMLFIKGLIFNVLMSVRVWKS